VRGGPTSWHMIPADSDSIEAGVNLVIMSVPVRDHG
jgi:hypothetical protein